MAASATGNANLDMAGKSTSGTTPITFMTHTKKNSESRNGRNRSPFLPRDGLSIWSRTNSSPNSPIFWNPRGTIFGLWKASQEKPTTSSAQNSASAIGLVKWKEPIENSGLKYKFVMLGAG